MGQEWDNNQGEMLATHDHHILLSCSRLIPTITLYASMMWHIRLNMLCFHDVAHQAQHAVLPRCGTSGSTCCASMTDVCFIQVCGNNANNILWSRDMVFLSPQCPASYLTTFRKITILQTCIRLDPQKFPGIQVFIQNKNVYHTDGWYQDN